jgi:hypothetical protein
LFCVGKKEFGEKAIAKKKIGRKYCRASGESGLVDLACLTGLDRPDRVDQARPICVRMKRSGQQRPGEETIR